MYSKTSLERPLRKNTKIGFQDQLLLNAGQKYCRMLHGEHSAIVSTFIKLLFSIKNFILPIFKWPLKKVFLYTLMNSVDTDKLPDCCHRLQQLTRVCTVTEIKFIFREERMMSHFIRL